MLTEPGNHWLTTEHPQHRRQSPDLHPSHAAPSRSSPWRPSSDSLSVDLFILDILHKRNYTIFCLVQFSSVTQSCPTLCDPMNHSTPGLTVHHQLPEFTQTHVHRVGDAIQPSHPPSSPSPPALNP